MSQRQFQKSIIRENTRGEREILIPVQMHTSSSRGHQTYEGDSELETHQLQQVQERIVSLTMQLDEWKSKCIHLEDHLDKFDTFISRYNDLSKEHDELVMACQQREDEMHQMELKFEELESTINSLKEDNNDLSNQLKRKKNENTDLLKKHMEQLQAKQEEMDDMKQNLYKMETQEKKKRKTFQINIAKLNDKIIDLEAENHRLQDSLDKYKKEISTLKSTISQYQNREETSSQSILLPLPQPSQRKDKSSETENYLKQQIEQLTSDLKFKEQQLEEHREKDAERLNKLRSQLQQIKKDLRQCKSRCEELLNKNAELQSTNQQLTEAVKRYEKDIEAIRTSRKPQQKCNHPAKIKSLEEQIERLKDLLKDKSSKEGEQDQEKLHKLTEQLREDRNNNKKNITNLEKTIKQLESQLAEEREQNSRLVDLLDKREKELNAMKYKSEKEAPAPTDRESDEEYQRLLKDFKKEIDSKNQSHKKLVEQMQAEITDLRKKLQRQQVIEPKILQSRPTTPPLPFKGQSKIIEEYTKVIEQRDKEILELKLKYDELQRYNMMAITSIEQENLKLIQILEAERTQSTVKQLAIGDSKKLIMRLQTQLTKVNEELERIKQTTSCLAWKQKQNLLMLEKRLQKSEQYIMREDERQLYEAKISSKNQLIELLSLKLRSIEQEYLRALNHQNICFYR